MFLVFLIIDESSSHDAGFVPRLDSKTQVKDIGHGRHGTTPFSGSWVWMPCEQALKSSRTDSGSSFLRSKVGFASAGRSVNMSRNW